MEFVVGVHHAFVELACGIGQLSVDVQVANSAAIGHCGKVAIDAVDFRHDRHVVVTGEDACHNDHGIRCLRLHRVNDCFEASCDFLNGRVDAGGRYRVADVVGAGQQHNYLRIDAIEFAVFETPEDVLDAVGAPAEIARVPAEEVLRPVFEELGIVGGAPAAGDGVAFEVDVDSVRRDKIQLGKYRAGFVIERLVKSTLVLQEFDFCHGACRSDHPASTSFCYLAGNIANRAGGSAPRPCCADR